MTKQPHDPTSSRCTIAVPGGRARLLGELAEAGDAEGGDIIIQALERSDGFQLIRLGYRRNGRLIRGPVSIPPDAWRRLLLQADADPVIAPLVNASATVARPA